MIRSAYAIRHFTSHLGKFWQTNMKSAGIFVCTFVKGGDGLGCDGRRW